MALDGGSGVRASVLLDLAQFDAQTEVLKQKVAGLGDILQKIPDVKPSLDTKPLEEGSKKAEGVLGELAASLAKLTGGAVTLNTAQLEGAAAHASTILGGVTEDFVKLEAVSGLAGATIAAVVVGAGVALLKMGQDFEAGFRLITARTGETGAALEGLRENVEQLAATGRGSIGTFAQEVAILHSRLGETGEALTSTAIAITDYAKATGSDAVQSTQELTRLFNLFHVSTEDTRAALDALVTVQQHTGTSQDTLRSSLQASGAILKQYGLDIQEATAFLGLLDQAGANSQQVAFGLRKALGDLSGPEAKTQLFDLISTLGTASDQTLAHSVAVQVFGTRSATALLDLARSGKLSLEGINEALTGTDGATAKAAQDMQSAADKIEIAFNKAKLAWAADAVAIAEAASDMAVGVLAKLDEIGAGIDAFLASDAVRNFAKFLIDLKNFQPPGQTTRTAADIPGATGESPLQGPADRIGAAASQAATLLTGSGTIQGGAAAGAQADQAQTQAAAAQEAAEQQLIETDKALQAANADVRVSFDDFIHGTVPATAAVVTHAEELDKLINVSLQAKTGTLDFTAAIKALADNPEAEVTVLNLKAAWDTLDSAIKKITDTDVQAQLIQAQHNALLQTGAERLATLAAANAVAAQEVDKETEAEKLAEKAKNDHLHTIEQLADLAENSYGKALESLASAILPNLTAAEAEHVKQLEISKDWQTLAILLADKYGVSLTELNQQLQGTGASQAAFAQQGAASTKALADFVSDENKSRVSSLFGALSKGLDESTVAAAKQQEESGHLDAAIRTLAAAHGVSAEQAAVWEAAIKQGGAAATLAQQQIQALSEYVLSHGEMRLKIDVEIDKIEKAIGETQTAVGRAQTAFQDQMAKFADAETKAVDTHVHALSQIDTAQTKSVEQYNLASQKYALDVEQSQLKLDEASSKAIQTQSDAVSKIHEAQADAIDKYNQALGDAQAKLSQTYADAMAKYNEGVLSLQEAGTKATQTAVDAQIAAQRQLASAMESANDQLRQTAASASIALQSTQAALYGTQPGATTGSQQQTQNDILTKFYQAQGQAALAATGATDALNQAKLSAGTAANQAQQQLVDAQEKNTKALDKLAEAYIKTLDKADRDYDKTVRDAKEAEEKTLRTLDEQANKAVSQMTQAVGKALEENQAKQDDLARQKAQLDQKQMEDRAQFDEQRQHEAEKFADDEKLRRDAETAATRTFQDKMLEYQKKLADLQERLLNELTKKGTPPPQTVSLPNATFQETGVSFVGALVTELGTHIAGGGGG